MPVYTYLVDAIDPLLDSEPVDVPRLIKGSFGERLSNFKALKILVRSGKYKTSCKTSCSMNCEKRLIRLTFLFLIGIHLGAEIPNFYELVTAPASKISA